jgi:hypothetical protein
VQQFRESKRETPEGGKPDPLIQTAYRFGGGASLGTLRHEGFGQNAVRGVPGVGGRKLAACGQAAKLTTHLEEDDGRCTRRIQGAMGMEVCLRRDDGDGWRSQIPGDEIFYVFHGFLHSIARANCRSFPERHPVRSVPGTGTRSIVASWSPWNGLATKDEIKYCRGNSFVYGSCRKYLASGLLSLWHITCSGGNRYEAEQR